MVARRWQLGGAPAVLDLGCGIGHWGRLLSRALPRARVVGLDREPRWIAEARQRAAAPGLAGRFTYTVGAAEALPFEAGAFDVVTCQTLLIHVRDPAAVLAEMVRVTRPGGLVIAAEPTNASDLLVESVALGDPPALSAELVRFSLECQKGKVALGEGDNLIGERLLLLLRGAGLRDLEIRQNDRGWPMVPPYSSPFERAQAEEALDAAERNVGLWDEATTRRYFLAGGGREEDLPRLWSAVLSHRRRIADAIRAGTYSCAGGGLFYLAWGRR
jgi:SAM-dependent methyltransferase